MNKSKKHRLSFLPETDCSVLAIASHEKGYHLAWNLNNELGLQLVRNGEYKVTRKKTQVVQTFPLFSWYDQTRGIDYHLIANRSETGILVSQLKNIDYFLHISPRQDDPFLTDLVEHINRLPVVITAFSLDPANYPRLAEMIFE